jgi:hypothetical protein
MEYLKSGELFTSEMELKIRERIRNIEFIEKLPRHKTVTLYKCKVPVYRFKEFQPNNTVVKENPEVLIVGYLYALSYWRYDNSFHEDQMDYYIDKHITNKDSLIYLNSLIKLYNLLENSNLVMEEKYLNVCRTNETMTRENYEGIRKYISSAKPENFMIGFNLIMNYDYESSKEYIALLFGQSIAFAKFNPIQVLYKKKFHKDFPGIR